MMSKYLSQPAHICFIIIVTMSCLSTTYPGVVVSAAAESLHEKYLRTKRSFSSSTCEYLSVENAPVLYFDSTNNFPPGVLLENKAILSGVFQRFGIFNSHYWYRRIHPQFGVPIYIWFCRETWVFTLQEPPPLGTCDSRYVLLQSIKVPATVRGQNTFLHSPEEAMYLNETEEYINSLSSAATELPATTTKFSFASGSETSSGVPQQTATAAPTPAASSAGSPDPNILSQLRTDVGFWYVRYPPMVHSYGTTTPPISASSNSNFSKSSSSSSSSSRDIDSNNKNASLIVLPHPLILLCDGQETCPCVRIFSTYLGSTTEFATYRLQVGQWSRSAMPYYQFLSATQWTRPTAEETIALSFQPSKTILFFHSQRQQWIIGDREKFLDYTSSDQQRKRKIEYEVNADQRKYLRPESDDHYLQLEILKKELSLKKDPLLLGVEVQVNSTTFYSPEIFSILATRWNPVRPLSKEEIQILNRVTVTLSCDSRCVTATPTMSLDFPRLPLFWRRVLDSSTSGENDGQVSSSDFLRVEPLGSQRSSIQSNFASVRDYILRSNVTEYQNGELQILAVNPNVRLSVKYFQPSQHFAAGSIGDLTDLYEIHQVPGNFHWRNVLFWRGAYVRRNSNTFSGQSFSISDDSLVNGEVQYDSEERPWHTLFSKNLRTSVERISPEPPLTSSGFILGYPRSFVVGDYLLAATNQIYLEVDDVLHLLGHPAPRWNSAKEGGANAAMMFTALLRADVLFASSSTLSPVGNASCGCLLATLHGMTLGTFSTPKCDEFFKLSIHFRLSDFTSVTQVEKGAGLLLDPLQAVSFQFSQQCSASIARPLAISAIILNEESSATMLAEYGCNGTAFRVGCSCQHSTDGSWCGYGRTCFGGDCVGCSTSRDGVQIRAVTTTTLSAGTPWYFYKGSCYRVLPDSLTSSDGELLCREEQGHLVSLQSTDELNYVRALHVPFSNYGQNADFWLGGSYLRSFSRIHWFDGSEANFNESWASGEPLATISSLSSNERLCAISLSTSAEIRVSSCNLLKDVVCERVVCSALQTVGVRTDAANANVYRLGNSTPAGSTPLQPLNLSARLAQSNSLSLSMGQGSVNIQTAGRFDVFSFCIGVDGVVARACPGQAKVNPLNLVTTVYSGADHVLLAEDLTQSSCHTLNVPLTSQIRLQVTKLSPGSVECEYADWVDLKFCRFQTFAEMLCPRGWIVSSEDKCIQLQSVPATYPDAVQQCSRVGAELLIAEGRGEILFASLGSFAMFHPFWVGAEAQGGITQWTTIKKRSFQAGSAGVPSPVIGFCLVGVSVNDGSSSSSTSVTHYSSVRCVFPQMYFCVRSATKTKTETETETFTVLESLSRSPEGSFTRQYTQTMTLDSTQTLSTSETVSEHSFTDTDSLTATNSVTVTASDSEIIVRGNITLDSPSMILFSKLQDGIQVDLSLFGDGFRRDMVVGTHCFVTSDLWVNHWGRGIGRLSLLERGGFVTIAFGPASTTLNMTFGPREGYEIYNPENVAVDFSATAFRSGVKPRGLPIFLTVEPNQKCSFSCIARRFARYATFGLFVVSLMFGGDFTYILDYMAALFSIEADCNAEALPLPFVLHPFQVNIGSSPYRYSFGVAVCNSCLLLGLFLVHAAFVIRTKTRHHHTWESAMAANYFPGLLIFPFILFGPGGMVGISALVGFGSASERILALIMTCCPFLLYGWLFLPVMRESWFAARFIKRDDHREEQEAYFSSNVFVRFLFAPRGTWVSSDKELTFVSRFQWCFYDYKPPHWFGMYFVVLICCVAIVQSIRVFTLNRCIIITGCISFLFLTHFFMLIFFRPFLRRAHNFCSIIIFSFLLLSMGFHAVSQQWHIYFNGDLLCQLTALGTLALSQIMWIVLRFGQKYCDGDEFPAIPVPKSTGTEEAFLTENLDQFLAAMKEKAVQDEIEKSEEEKRAAEEKEKYCDAEDLMLHQAKAAAIKKSTMMVEYEEQYEREQQIFRDKIREKEEGQSAKKRSLLAGIESSSSASSSSTSSPISSPGKSTNMKKKKKKKKKSIIQQRIETDATLQKMFESDKLLVIGGVLHRLVDERTGKVERYYPEKSYGLKEWNIYPTNMEQTTTANKKPPPKKQVLTNKLDASTEIPQVLAERVSVLAHPPLPISPTLQRDFLAYRKKVGSAPTIEDQVMVHQTWDTLGSTKEEVPLDRQRGFMKVPAAINSGEAKIAHPQQRAPEYNSNNNSYSGLSSTSVFNSKRNPIATAVSSSSTWYNNNDSSSNFSALQPLGILPPRGSKLYQPPAINEKDLEKKSEAYYSYDPLSSRAENNDDEKITKEKIPTRIPQLSSSSPFHHLKGGYISSVLDPRKSVEDARSAALFGTTTRKSELHSTSSPPQLLSAMRSNRMEVSQVTPSSPAQEGYNALYDEGIEMKEKRNLEPTKKEDSDDRLPLLHQIPVVNAAAMRLSSPLLLSSSSSPSSQTKKASFQNFPSQTFDGGNSNNALAVKMMMQSEDLLFLNDADNPFSEQNQQKLLQGEKYSRATLAGLSSMKATSGASVAKTIGKIQKKGGAEVRHEMEYKHSLQQKGDDEFLTRIHEGEDVKEQRIKVMREEEEKRRAEEEEIKRKARWGGATNISLVPSSLL